MKARDVKPSRFRITIKVGVRPGSGLSSWSPDADVAVKLKTKQKEFDEIRLGNEAYKSLAKNNTAEFFVFSTIMHLGDVVSASMTLGGPKSKPSADRVYVTYLIVADIKAVGKGERRVPPRYFWINDWIGTRKPVTARAFPFKAFNSFKSLLKFYFTDCMSRAHFAVSIVTHPPHSLYTVSQRILVALVVVLATMAACAGSIGETPSPELGWSTVTDAAVLHGTFISLGAAAAAFPFRLVGRGRNSCSGRGLVRAVLWLGLLGTGMWCCSFTIQNGFDWDSNASEKWLGGVAVGLISTAIWEALCCLIVSAACTQFYTISGIVNNKGVIELPDGFDEEDDEAGSQQSTDNRFHPAHNLTTSPPLSQLANQHNSVATPAAWHSSTAGGHPSFRGVGAGQISRPAAWRNSMVGGAPSFQGALVVPPSMMGTSTSYLSGPHEAQGPFEGGSVATASSTFEANLGPAGSKRGSMRHNGFDGSRSVSSAGTRRTHRDTLTSLLVNPVMPWLYGKISRETAEEIMQPRTDGLYLIRESNRFAGDFTLCLW